MAGADGEPSSVDRDGARWRGWLDRGGCGAGGEGHQAPLSGSVTTTAPSMAMAGSVRG